MRSFMFDFYYRGLFTVYYFTKCQHRPYWTTDDERQDNGNDHAIKEGTHSSTEMVPVE